MCLFCVRVLFCVGFFCFVFLRFLLVVLVVRGGGGGAGVVLDLIILNEINILMYCSKCDIQLK